MEGEIEAVGMSRVEEDVRWETVQAGWVVDVMKITKGEADGVTCGWKAGGWIVSRTIYSFSFFLGRFRSGPGNSSPA